MLERTDDGWRLRIEGMEVSSISFGFLLDINLSGAEKARATIRVQGAFELALTDHAAQTLDATAEWNDLTAVLQLRHDRVTSVGATEKGDLFVTFDSGSALSAAPHEIYESWEAFSGGGHLVALPGGGLAVWGDEE